MNWIGSALADGQIQKWKRALAEALRMKDKG